METFINYAGLAIGLILAIIGIYFQLVDRRKKEPVYAKSNSRIIYDYVSQVKNLKISFNRKKVENLSICNVAFFNKGAEPITKADIETINHLRITPATENIKILDAEVIRTNNPSSNVTVEAINSEVVINFDYLNKNQGAIISVTHTGTSENDIQLKGEIVGVNQGLKNLLYKSQIEEKLLSYSEKIAKLSFKIIPFIFVFMLMIAPIALYSYYVPDSVANGFIQNLFQPIFAVLPILFLLFLFIGSIFLLSKSRKVL